MTRPNESVKMRTVGMPINRVDGPLKVTGTARYSAEIATENVAYAVIVQSAIARGAIERIETNDAEQLVGVITVLTHENSPQLESLQAFERQSKESGGGGGGG